MVGLAWRIVPVDPLLDFMLQRAPVASGPPLSTTETRANAHAMMTRMLAEHAEADTTTVGQRDHVVAVAGGTITVRVYTPRGRPPFPLHFYVHGGGFSRGLLSHFDAECRYLCETVGCVVASVGYRLAPEHKYPLPLTDCVTALQWAVDQAAIVGIDPQIITIGGVSAGANLAAAVAFIARSEGGPAIGFQVLEIPLLDLTLSQPSVVEFAEGYGLTRAALEQTVVDYLDDPTDALDALASPLLARDFSGLPPALIMTAEFDPLRDQGAQFATRLRAAGIEVELCQWDGHVHGAASFTALLPSARAYRDRIVAALRNFQRSSRISRGSRRSNMPR